MAEFSTELTDKLWARAPHAPVVEAPKPKPQRKRRTPEEARERNRTSVRNRYWSHIAAGLCGHCGRARGKDGTDSRCRRCVVASREARQRALAKLASKGACLTCGGKVLPGAKNKRHCARCAKKRADRRTDLRNQRINEGRCIECDSLRGDDGTTTLCRPCADVKARRAAKNRKSRAKG